MNDAAPSMLPCSRRCGLFVAADGPATCGPCQAADGSRRAEEERERARLANLIVTERRVGRHVIRTQGYAIAVRSIYDEAEFASPSELLFSSEARALALAIVESASFVEGLKSPTKEPAVGTATEAA